MRRPSLPSRAAWCGFGVLQAPKPCIKFWDIGFGIFRCAGACRLVHRWCSSRPVRWCLLLRRASRCELGRPCMSSPTIVVLAHVCM